MSWQLKHVNRMYATFTWLCISFEIRTHIHFVIFVRIQGRRRIFKSGPAEEAIECRRHERGEHERGITPPLVWRGLGASPEKIFKFWALLCSFLMEFLCVWDQILVVLVTKIFLVEEKPNAGQNCFQTVTWFLFTFFLFSMFLWHYFIYVPAGFSKVL